MAQLLDIETVKDRFRSARGVVGDAAWAQSAFDALVFSEGVRSEYALEAVADLSPTVAEAGESPEILFGDPARWAEEQRAQWRTDGIDVDSTSDRISLYELVGTTLLAAAGIGVASAISALLGGRLNGSERLVMFLFPVLIALIIGVCTGTFDALLRRYPRRWAWTLTAALGVAATIGLVWAFGATRDISINVTVFSYVGLVAVCAVGALVVIWLSPDPVGSESADGPADDATWAAQLAVRLRQREDMTDAEIDRIVAEARAHARDSGTRLNEEFGSPAAYAARFDHNPSFGYWREGRYSLVMMAATSIIAITPLVEGRSPSWENVAAALLFVSFAVHAWRDFSKAKRTRRGAAAGSA